MERYVNYLEDYKIAHYKFFNDDENLKQNVVSIEQQRKRKRGRRTSFIKKT